MLSSSQNWKFKQNVCLILDGQGKEADLIEEEDEEDQSSEVQFPDTEIRIEHTADNK